MYLDQQFYPFEPKSMRCIKNLIDYVIYWMESFKFCMIQILTDSRYVNQMNFWLVWESYMLIVMLMNKFAWWQLLPQNGVDKKLKNGAYSILISSDSFAFFQSNVTKNFFHLLGLNQSQIRLDDRLFFEKIMEY